MFIRFVFWLWKQNHKHTYWPDQFDKYLDEFILANQDNIDYWSIKDSLNELADVQDLIKANTDHLLEFLRIASHFKGFYIGFTHNIAIQIIINGELDDLKPPEVKASDGKKKKGKKGAKKAEPEPDLKPKKPPPETIPISAHDMLKCFYQSLSFLVQE